MQEKLEKQGKKNHKAELALPNAKTHNGAPKIKMVWPWYINRQGSP